MKLSVLGDGQQDGRDWLTFQRVVPVGGCELCEFPVEVLELCAREGVGQKRLLSHVPAK